MTFEKVKTETVETFKSKNGWIFDIVTQYDNGTEKWIESWIYFDNYGVKDYMFGCPIPGTTIKSKADYIELLLDNISDYASDYQAAHMEYETNNIIY